MTGTTTMSHLAPRRGKDKSAEDMVAGFGSGFTAVFLGFPLDVIKTRLQTLALQERRTKKDVPTVWKMGRTIVQKEGMSGLYKGLASPLFTMSVSGSICFVSYGKFQSLYNGTKGWHYGNWLAGLSCGPITGVVSTVENHIRTQMQIDNVHKRRFRSSFHCATKIFQQHGGVATLFTGWGVTTLKDCAYFSTYFFVYEGLKHTLQNIHAVQGFSPAHTTVLSTAAIPLAGGAAGTAAWLVAYPLDCIRAAQQGQSLLRGGTPTSWQVFQTLFQTRGVRGFFLGVTPTLVRASIVHSIRFTVYEGILWLFQHARQEELRHCPHERTICCGAAKIRG